MFNEIALPETNKGRFQTWRLKDERFPFWDGATWQPDFCFRGGGGIPG